MGKKRRERGRRKVRVGVVVSDKMDKSVVVAVERRFRHPLYGKVIRRMSKYYAHDEMNQCRVGDSVEVMETRPLSKLKHWRVVRIIERAKRALVTMPGVEEEIKETLGEKEEEEEEEEKEEKEELEATRQEE